MLTQLLKSSLPHNIARQLGVIREISNFSLSEMLAVPAVVRPRSIGGFLLPFFRSRRQGFEHTVVWLNGAEFPLELRKGTSDFECFRHIFLAHQYRPLCMGDPHIVIDAGANVGLASLYFLHRYPQVRVIALEPDPENFELAERNLRPFQDRCQILHAALWSHDTTLALQRGTFRDGRHWATQVIPPELGAAQVQVAVPAYSVSTLLDRFKISSIDILKIDIEGAEGTVFGQGDTTFLARTRACAVECHDAQASDIFRSAASAYGLQVRREGELTLACNPAPNTAEFCSPDLRRREYATCRSN
jgi:FkbM family methyltransferase